MKREEGHSANRSLAISPAEALSFDAKNRIARIVAEDGLTRFNRPVVMWTGGKDSMLALSYVRKASEDRGTTCPPVLFIDHGMHFDETWSLFEEVRDSWQLEPVVARNEDVLTQASKPGSPIRVEQLTATNQREARRTGHGKATFSYALDSIVANHLLKTVPMNEAIREHEYDAVVTGIRWDENEARSRERFVSPRSEPPHARIHPILHFTEREVWMETLRRGLPLHPLYEKGYRSIDGVYDSQRTGELPAWEQDLEGSSERAGRAQDKELLMQRLRELGYM